jgi:hypothetical protein
MRLLAILEMHRLILMNQKELGCRSAYLRNDLTFDGDEILKFAE